jgi:NAD-dependent deacetylase
MLLNSNAQKIVETLLQSKKTVITTGAGISTASGIKGFRDPKGPWRDYDPSKMTLEYFMVDPDYLWRMVYLFLFQRERAKPNLAHQALVDMERMGILDTIITQNIDGLHQMAGARNVIEFWGGLTHCYCLNCGFRVKIGPSLIYPPVLNDVMGLNLKAQTTAPTCKKCDRPLMPELPLYDTPLDEKNVYMICELAVSAELLLVIGTRLEFGPIGLLPEITKQSGGLVAIINDSTTIFDDEADMLCRGNAEEILPKIVRAVREQINAVTC